MFKEADNHSPSLIVIDNIDALFETDNFGKHALNKEMDFQKRGNLSVIGITRKGENIDSHFRRYGKFDV